MSRRTPAKQIATENERARILSEENTRPSVKRYTARARHQRLIFAGFEGILLGITPGNAIENDDSDDCQDGDEKRLNH